jgi:hypothetical protein
LHDQVRKSYIIYYLLLLCLQHDLDLAQVRLEFFRLRRV